MNERIPLDTVFLENSQADFERETALYRLSQTIEKIQVATEREGLNAEILSELLKDE